MKAFPLRLDDDLHRRAKVAAASEGVALNAVLTDLLRRYVEQVEEEHPTTRLSIPSQPSPPPPFQPPASVDEIPPEPPRPEFQSELMRRTHGQS